MRVHAPRGERLDREATQESWLRVHACQLSVCGLGSVTETVPQRLSLASCSRSRDSRTRNTRVVHTPSGSWGASAVGGPGASCARTWRPISLLWARLPGALPFLCPLGPAWMARGREREPAPGPAPTPAATRPAAPSPTDGRTDGQTDRRPGNKSPSHGPARVPSVAGFASLFASFCPAASLSVLPPPPAAGAEEEAVRSG